MTIQAQDLDQYDRIYRLNLINSLPGIKNVCLIGTSNDEGHSNLSIFNSVVHIGASPAMLGMIMRPLTVSRHTYANIKSTGQYTINVVPKQIIDQAHQCSANYDASVSEFAATGLTEEYLNGFNAPYVKECSIKIGMSLEEEHEIKANGTILIVGKVESIYLPKKVINENGIISHQRADTAAIGGLNLYHSLQEIVEKGYARVPKD